MTDELIVRERAIHAQEMELAQREIDIERADAELGHRTADEYKALLDSLQDTGGGFGHAMCKIFTLGFKRC